MKQQPSGRATEHATLVAGLINLNVSIYTLTASDAGIKRKQFVEVEENGETVSHPVGYANVDKVTGEEVPYSSIVKKVETDYGFVHVDDHEIEEKLNLSPKTIEIKAVQPRYLFDQGHYVTKGIYEVVARKIEKGRTKVDDPRAQQNLELILKALDVKGQIAFVEFTTRGVPKPAVLLPDGTLHVVHFEEELREKRPRPDLEIPDEVAEAAYDQYFAAYYSEEVQDLEDKRTALIQALADEKAAAGDFDKAEAPAETETVVSTAPDLLAQLQASIDAAKAS